ncbi:MAG: hypothetical protein A3F31_03440 [Candidatus Levybacteria bacterium RIFCSPHIGHO2_12_FULL_38_12]|nr:MAG: hypothetical protein A2770_03865 [Candidatus Levybacteria bacterium RIFCSPHIGHO2_01_FULL_38_12]OGH22152.1 MAG: hypothetical protein A3D75_02810 [Candidatus Levybacteria bacterium RIFCSPHIGHO2_02_FULL_37_18]OGH22999.1 MAG: hypothetical protein A3F31_03440 [Candidatus Levybacteria bacterium RIFCSPHIGHO2_12_FULL_38_12]OGH34171.1 MAG: hypothetical protein A3A47_03570 [Candidatus Levybacteria bacterium RIFCSPLOWO2_01_FULL_37_20]OGH44964.1 MAG: hypothetical protein A3J14_01240 [Candidatus Lev
MIVVDASVIFKWVKPDEEESEPALFLFEKFKRGEEQIVVPKFAFIEIANALATKSDTTSRTITKSLEFLYSLQFGTSTEEKVDLIE